MTARIARDANLAPVSSGHLSRAVVVQALSLHPDILLTGNGIAGLFG